MVQYGPWTRFGICLCPVSKMCTKMSTSYQARYPGDMVHFAYNQF
jgi:hypothetical protein